MIGMQVELPEHLVISPAQHPHGLAAPHAPYTCEHMQGGGAPSGGGGGGGLGFHVHCAV